jgi:uncharacterized paraquat-inducible protein A
MYKRLAKHLNKTRKPLWQVCKELDIVYDEVDLDRLEELCTQCTHCDIWTVQPILDLDQNPICPLCARLAGL